MQLIKTSKDLRRVGFVVLGCGFAILAASCQPAESSSNKLVEETDAQVAPPDPLTVLIIDAPEIGSQIKRQWRARRDGQLTVVDQTLGEWNTAKFQTQADVVLYPSGVLADLVKLDRLLPVPDDVWASDDVSRRDILKHSRQPLIEYDEKIWALPMTGPQWMLLYRADLLEAAEIEVPRTWEQWSEAVARIRDADMPVAVEDRVSVPLAANWATHSFLLRCAATIRQRGKLSTVFDRSNMEPLIDQPPFVQALDDLKKHFGKLERPATPAKAWQQMTAGNCVMAIGWPMNIQSDDSDVAPDELDYGDSILIAAVPGSESWFDLQSKQWMERPSPEDQKSVSYLGFGGLVASVSSESRLTSSAFDFLQWLGSKSMGAVVLTGSQQSGPIRKSQLKSLSKWTGPQLSPAGGEAMAHLIRETNGQSVTLMFPRLPGYYDYIRSLDRHVRKCLEDEFSAQEALSLVAQEWDSITDQIGREAQTANLRRANGL